MSKKDTLSKKKQTKKTTKENKLHQESKKVAY